jgi:putative ABC transport system permease protein
VTDGRLLNADDKVTFNQKTQDGGVLAHLPVILNSSPQFDQGIHVTVHAASANSVDAVTPSFPTLAGFEGGTKWPYVAALTLGQLDYAPVKTVSTSLDESWLGRNGGSFIGGTPWRTAVDASVDSANDLQYAGGLPALSVKPVADVQTGFDTYERIGGDLDAPPSVSQDTSLRTLTSKSPGAGSDASTSPLHQFTVLGRYSAGCAASGSALAGSGYDIYSSPATTQSDGRSMGANASMTNFVAPMPEIMTNLEGGSYFSDPKRFAGGMGDRFISAIRVKVSDTTEPGPASQNRLERVAALIHRQTGLAVDVIKGSSTQSVSVALPAGNYGRPAMTVKQEWLTENVGITFFKAITDTTLVMSIVVGAVAVLLTMQTAYASVRRRRSELVLLRAIGWPAWRVALLMELEVITIGVIVAVVALIVGGLMVVLTHPDGTVVQGVLLAGPLAIGLTTVAGAGPAATAAATRPLPVLRGPGRAPRRRRRILRGPLALGIREALTTWRWQTLLGVLATAVGAMFLGAVLGIVNDFHASLDSTALARKLGDEVGPFDILLGVLAVGLGATTAIGVVLVATRERLPHFATLRALGWPRDQIARVVAAQALTVGLLGGALGVGALAFLGNRLHSGISLTLASQISPLLLGLVTGIAATVVAVRAVYRHVIISVIRIG